MGTPDSDVYAFGCVLYEMLTGQRVTRERKPLEHEALEAIVETCLENDPEDRWQSARDLKRALLLAATARAPKERPAGGRLPLIAAVVALAAVAVGVWSLRPSAPAGYPSKPPIPKSLFPTTETSQPGSRILWPSRLTAARLRWWWR